MDQFCRHRRRKDGIDTQCRDCKGEVAKAWRNESGPPRYRQSPCALIDNGDGTHSVPLTKGHAALIDSVDAPLVDGFIWYASWQNGKFYARAEKDGKTILMHRTIMLPDHGQIVDHISGDSLDNRRSNLRICTHAQNRANQSTSYGSTGYIGVFPRGNRYYALMIHQGKRFYGGTFDTAIAAAKARDRIARELHGEFVSLNFPDECE
jgi:hypothetical protein